MAVKITFQCLYIHQERIRGGGGGEERVTRASAKPGEIWQECYFGKSSTHLTSTTTGNHRTASIFSTAQGFRLHYRPYALLPEVTRSSPPPPPPPPHLLCALDPYNVTAHFYHLPLSSTRTGAVSAVVILVIAVLFYALFWTDNSS